MSKIILELKNCTVTDKKQNSLIQQVSLEVKENECVGIIGESGSGKTMTARALLQILPMNLKVSAEAMKINGHDLMKMNAQQKSAVIGSEIGFVPQNTVAYLHPLIKIKNQITDGYLNAKKGTKKEAFVKALELLSLVNISDPMRVMNSYPGQLSGGMRQRVNIAMALMCDPKLIIADEPTTALDCIVQKQVTELFFKIHQERHVALVMISHNLMMLKKYCDRIIVMYAGQVIEMGTVDEVFNHPKHPYTKALIAVIPNIHQDPEQPLIEIPGYVPEKGRNRSSCLFAERCLECRKECLEPLVFNQSDSHFVRCAIHGGR